MAMEETLKHCQLTMTGTPSLAVKRRTSSLLVSEFPSPCSPVTSRSHSAESFWKGELLVYQVPEAPTPQFETPNTEPEMSKPRW